MKTSRVIADIWKTTQEEDTGQTGRQTNSRERERYKTDVNAKYSDLYDHAHSDTFATNANRWLHTAWPESRRSSIYIIDNIPTHSVQKTRELSRAMRRAGHAHTALT